jgi:hypothetical protein
MDKDENKDKEGAGKEFEAVWSDNHATNINAHPLRPVIAVLLSILGLAWLGIATHCDPILSNPPHYGKSK